MNSLARKSVLFGLNLNLLKNSPIATLTTESLWLSIYSIDLYYLGQMFLSDSCSLRSCRSTRKDNFLSVRLCLITE